MNTPDTPFTTFIGIDPAAESFTVCAYHQAPTHTFANTTDGRAAFLKWLDQHPRQTTLVLVENTGVYSEALAYELHEAAWPLVVVDPFKVWKAFGTSGPKTDPVDSRKIAEYGLRYTDRLTLWQPNAVIVEQVKVLLTTREQLVEQKTALINTHRMLKRKVIQTPLAMQALEQSIAQLKQQIRRLEQQVRVLIEQNPRTGQMLALVLTAPGVGLLLAAHLFVLTKGYKEGGRYRRLANYLGIAPHAYTSGTSVRRRARSHGFGPAKTRKLLHLAARSVCTHKAKYRRYYERKREAGKAPVLVYNNVANKLLRVLCSMLVNERAYVADYKSIQPRLLHASSS